MEVEGSVSQKLVNFRKILEGQKLDAFLVSYSDSHCSEYLPKSDERIKFVSNFSGSNGLGLISQQKALLWTDSRYFIQAKNQLEPGWELMKMGIDKPWFEYISDHLPAGSSVGFDPAFLSQGQTILTSVVTPEENINVRYKSLEKNGFKFVAVESNPVDELWTDKPARPSDPIFVHDESYTGRTVEEKIGDFYAKIAGTKPKNAILTVLEDIAWILNVRGADHNCNPIFISYLLIHFEGEGKELKSFKGTLFVSPEKVNAEVDAHLKKYNISVDYYEKFFDAVKQITEGPISVNKATCNGKVYRQINKGVSVVDQEMALEELRGNKNEREVRGLIECHKRDGAAVVAYLAWLEEQLVKVNREDLDEYIVTEKLEELRRLQKNNRGISFETISSSGPNCAIVHYKPEKGKAALLKKELIYLLDSGGQYLDGTTDVTRTVHFGTPTEEERDAYTRVLLGNLDVERVVFPAKKKYSGQDIDVLARRHLWKKGLDYGHGTGHGVGYFLNVHEGPHGISKYRTHPFSAGMVVSNEPGYYKEGEFGIRIENIILVEGKEDWFNFRNLTIIPYCRNLISKALLSEDDRKYIDDFHKQVFETLSPILQENKHEYAIEWLKRETAPL